MPNPNKAHGFIAEFVLAGTAVPMFSGLLASNITIADGDALYVSNGLIRLAIANQKRVVGVAAHPAIAITNTRQIISFVPALESIVFSGQYGSATGLQFTQGLLWSRRNLVGASGVQRLSNATAASNGIAWIIGLRRTSAFGTYGEAMFIWSRSAFSARNCHTISGLVI